MEIRIKLTIPDELLDGAGDVVSRSVLEQVIAESYKNGQLNLKQVRNLLGFSSRYETEDFLHTHSAYEYTLDDLKSDLNGLKDLGLR